MKVIPAIWQLGPLSTSLVSVRGRATGKSTCSPYKASLENSTKAKFKVRLKLVMEE